MNATDATPVPDEPTMVEDLAIGVLVRRWDVDRETAAAALRDVSDELDMPLPELAGLVAAAADAGTGMDQLPEQRTARRSRTARGTSDEVAAQLGRTAVEERLRLVAEAQLLRAQIAELEISLLTRPVIDQAKGIVMARYDVDADRAYDVLRHWAQESDVTVRSLAQSVVQAVCSAPGIPGIDPEVVTQVRRLLRGRPPAALRVSR